ncbi:MAG: metallopeptidase TldD-related protein [Candidatus Delongbacteria bacterium]|nr:metallopeptidase TldD-related protein [Candidatus Delongbacteria bacterium]
MTNREIADKCIAEFKAKGMDKSKVMINDSEVRELYFNNGDISMLRTTFNTSVQLTAIKDDKKGATSTNKTDDESVAKAIKDTVSLAESSNPEPANDISEFQPAEEFCDGVMEADNDKMYFRLNEFLNHVKTAYPMTQLREGGVSYHKSTLILKNSNGVDYAATGGYYQFMAMFSSKEGEKTSSFNYTYKLLKELEEPFIEAVNLKLLLEHSKDEVNARAFDQKFEGDIIITPDCMGSMIGPVLGHLQDYAYITGTSLFKGKLGQKVADEKLTIRSSPVSDDFAYKSFFSGDGYKNENLSLIENGVLRSNMLTLFGAKKTGMERSKTNGACLSIDGGNIELDEMIKNTKKGILLSRFSGGHPNDNGDFSGIAKNSYYIEDGEIKYPVKEIMVTGNLITMINSIVEISKEVTDFGYTKYPWMKVSGITISGK